MSVATKSANTNINQDSYSKILFSIPKRTEQENVLKILDKHSKNILNEIILLAKLKKLKHGLMEDLLTGKVRVSSLLNKQENNNGKN